ncbi:MAG: class I SAM-dependent methyltransferase [Gammaproteobacteria bacterium]
MNDHSFERGWRERFTEFAEGSDDDAGIAGWTAFGLAARVRRFTQVWPGDQAGAIWVDAGCGAGTYTRLLASKNLNVIGLDYSATSIYKARERSHSVSGWGVADVLRLPVRREVAAGVLCLGVTQALSSSDGVVAELTQCVRPGGQIWVDGLNAWCLPHVWERMWRRLQGRPPHVRYESPWRLRRLLRRHGAEHVKLFWLPVAPGRLRSLQVVLEKRWVQALFAALPIVGALFSHSMLVCGDKPHGPEHGG